MKTNMLFQVDFAKVETIYSVFKSCNVFTLLLGDELVPIYDFSGSNPRSSLNSLRKYYPDGKVTFYCKSSFPSQSTLLPYHMILDKCLLFF